MCITHGKGEVNGQWVVVFTPTVPHVTVIANGFQPHLCAECCKSGCVMRWHTWCGLGVGHCPLEASAANWYVDSHPNLLSFTLTHDNSTDWRADPGGVRSVSCTRVQAQTHPGTQTHTRTHTHTHIHTRTHTSEAHAHTHQPGTKAHTHSHTHSHSLTHRYTHDKHTRTHRWGLHTHQVPHTTHTRTQHTHTHRVVVVREAENAIENANTFKKHSCLLGLAWRVGPPLHLQRTTALVNTQCLYFPGSRF